MLYFSNQELATTYHVSVRTVRNWIDSAREGKLNLTLHAKGERHYIANTSRNVAIIQDLVKNNKKFRPHKAQKTVMPQSKFYELFDERQIFDIISSIEVHHEIPMQYNYFSEGARAWDDYTNKLAHEDNPNNLNASWKLLTSNKSYFDMLFSKYKKVNIIDLGVGNAMPVKNFLTYMLETGKLGRYVGLDISSELLEIAGANIDKWFGGKIDYEVVQIDFSQQRFTQILANEYNKEESGEVANVLLLLGDTLCNLRVPGITLRNINESMGFNDYLIYEKKLDSASTRNYFDFNVNNEEIKLPLIFSFVVNLLNIDSSMYDLDVGYNPDLRERYERIRFKLAVSIRFVLESGERYIHLNKGDSILVWRSKQQTALDVINQFDQNDFYPLHVSQTDSKEYMLTISNVKRS